MSKTTDFSKVDKLVDKLMTAGLNSLGNDVKKRAIILAPFGMTRKSGKHLRETARVDVNGSRDIVTISFNKPYARRRHYENNLNPSTKYYLSNALKSITNVSKYFRSFN